MLGESGVLSPLLAGSGMSGMGNRAMLFLPTSLPCSPLVKDLVEGISSVVGTHAELLGWWCTAYQAANNYHDYIVILTNTNNTKQ